MNKKYKGRSFHIDTYDSTNNSFNLTSLALLLDQTPRADQLRKIIIDKSPPTFLQKLPAVVAKRGAPILKRLNPVQQRAVLKALTAKDFLLIQGMPGTGESSFLYCRLVAFCITDFTASLGKTATIVALIELLVALNKTVLLTSHTHSSVDNVCLRLVKQGVNFLRLGSDSKVHASLKSKTEYHVTNGCTSTEQLQEIYNSFVSGLLFKPRLFSGRVFLATLFYLFFFRTS